MRVLLIHQAYVTGAEAGGTRHAELGQRLAAAGDELIVVASTVSYLTGRRVGGDGASSGGKRRGARVVRAWAPATLHRGFGWRVVAFVAFAVTSMLASLRVGRVDVVVGTSPPIFQAVSALAVARMRRRPFVLEIRDLWPDVAIELGVLGNPLLQAPARRLERFLYRRADHLIVNSPAYRPHLQRRGVERGRISLVPNGVDPGMFRPAERGQAVRDRFGLQGKQLAVYAGAHGPANDLGVVLAAAAELRHRPDIHVLLVGDGKDRPALEAEAARRRLANVTFAGPVPKAEIPGVLAAADVCLATLRDIPLFRTTYPNKVFDYMAAGRPVVLAIDGVIRRVVEEAAAGVAVPPGDGRALATAIAALMDDPALRARMGAAGRARVERHFDRDRQAELLRTVLQAVAGGAPPPPGREADAA